jgi:hypothetical protein
VLNVAESFVLLLRCWIFLNAFRSLCNGLILKGISNCPKYSLTFEYVDKIKKDDSLANESKVWHYYQTTLLNSEVVSEKGGMLKNNMIT